MPLIWSEAEGDHVLIKTSIYDCKYMKIICVNCSLRNESASNLHSYEHNLSSSENKAWKKARPEFEHDLCNNSAVLYQLS